MSEGKEPEGAQSGEALQVTSGRPIAPNIRKLESLYADDGRLRPGTNTRTIIRLVYDSCPWLRDTDYPTVRTWAQFELAASRAYTLVEHVTDAAEDTSKQLSSDEIVKVLSEFRQLRSQQNQVGDRLGLNPRARKSLDVGDEKPSGEDDWDGD